MATSERAQNTITVDINGSDYRGRVLPHDETWEAAALRAVQRRFGKAAAVWRWTLDSSQQDRNGVTVRVGYKATVVGRQNSRRDGGGWPILGEARVWIVPPRIAP